MSVTRKRPRKIPRLIFQAPAQLFLRPVEGAADGAFIDATAGCDLRYGLLLEIVGNNGLPLEFCQLLLNDPLYSLKLDVPGQSGTQVTFKEYISHCGNTPFRSSGLSGRTTRSFESVRG